MADDDASGRFDKQNERGGETSAEGKDTGLFVVLWQGKTNCWLRVRIISCIGCVIHLIEKVVSRESCKKLRFKGPRFILEKLTLRSYRNRRGFIIDGGEGKFAYKRKCSLFIFVSHAERKWSFACFNSISLWGAPLWPRRDTEPWRRGWFFPAEKTIPICCSYFSSAFVEIFPLLL